MGRPAQTPAARVGEGVLSRERHGDVLCSLPWQCAWCGNQEWRPALTPMAYGADSACAHSLTVVTGKDAVRWGRKKEEPGSPLPNAQLGTPLVGGPEAAPRIWTAAGGNPTGQGRGARGRSPGLAGSGRKSSRAGPNEPQQRSGLAAEERTPPARGSSRTRATARRVYTRARPVGNGRAGPRAPAATRTLANQ